MPVRTTITSGDFAIPASASLIPMLIVCCAGGTVGSVYTFEPGAACSDSLGGGIGTDACYAALRGIGSTVRCVVAEPTWTGAPSITHTGTGPTVTCALADGADGCYDDHRFLLTVTTGGAGGEGAAFSVCYDGATVAETVPVPAEVPAVLRGAVDITYGAVLTGYVATVLTPEHLDFTAPAAKVLTFGTGSLAASAAGLRAAFATSVAVQTWVPGDLLAAGIAAILANGRKLIFTTAGGTASDAPASCTITGTLRGAAQTEVLNLSQVAGAVSSAKVYDTITTIVFAAGDGNGATIALGYTSAFADGAEIVAAANALAVAAPLAMAARLASTATAQYLEWYSTSAGAGVTATIDAGASTADTTLGFTVGDNNLTATGAAATWSPPWTGLTFTFPASADYVAGDTYSATATGPRASLAAIVDAAQAAHDNYINAPFGKLAVMQPAPDAPTAKATNDALAALTDGTWTPDPYAPIFVEAVNGTQFHTASATVATNDANITTADAAVLLAFSAAAANLDSVALDDCYVTGAPQLVPGSFRRTAVLPWIVKACAKTKLAADVADGLLPSALGCSLLGPDGLTRARDAASATTHMEANLGFSCLRRTAQGLGFPKFAPGYTRAGATSRLRFEGVVATCLETATLAFPVAERWEGETDVADPTTGMLTGDAKKRRAAAIYTVLAPTLQPPGGDPNVSDFTVEVLDPVTGRFVDNNEVRVKIVLYVLGEIITVYVAISASGVVTTIAA